MPQQSRLLVGALHALERRGMSGIAVAPAPEVPLDIGLLLMLQPRKPAGCLAANLLFVLRQAKLHDSLSIKQPVDLRNSLGHLLLDALNAESGPLGNLGVGQAVYAVREKDLPGSRL